MTTKSMTGFARADGNGAGLNWYWEVRSVNGRGLDVRVRLPSGYERLDQAVRKAVSGALVRGNVSVQLFVQRSGGDLEIQLNEGALRQVLGAAEKIRELTGAGPVSTEALLQVKGVLEIAEPEEADELKAERERLLLETLGTVLLDVTRSREGEGEKLSEAVAGVLVQIENRVAEIASHPSRAPEAILERVREQLRRLTSAELGELDPQRLHQEAVLLAGKADVEEELQRLRAHISAARELLVLKEPVGRKLDFLTQEFNREANTICSKANDIAITQAGLAMKATIEQMREQVQNIE